MVRATVSILLLIAVGLVTEGRADDWPQYRGPKRDGVSRETGLLKAWPKGEPKLLWIYRDAGAGFSSPSIVGNHFDCMGSKDMDDVVFALETNTGKLLWTTSAGPRRLTDWGDGPCSTPTVDGDYLYAITWIEQVEQIGFERPFLAMQPPAVPRESRHWRFERFALSVGDELAPLIASLRS